MGDSYGKVPKKQKIVGGDYELHVSLVITDSDISPDEVTSILSFPPSIARRKGDVIPKTTVVHEHNLWELRSGVPPINSLFATHLTALERQLRPISKRFLLLPKSVYVELSCHVSNQSEYSYPSLHLSLDSIRFFAAIGAEIDVDIRDLS